MMRRRGFVCRRTEGPLRRRVGTRLRWQPSIEQLEGRTVPSTLIPVTNRADLVFDAARNQLDITTTGGAVQRWDVATQTLLTPLAVGTTLAGADITPDGDYLYATETQTGGGQGVVHQVSLTTGAVTDLTYPLAFMEGGSFDVAVGPNGKGLFDGRFNGSGWVPMRQIDLATGTLTTRTDDPGSGGGGQVRQDTQVQRSADRSLYFFTESNISSGPIFTYNAVTDTFSAKPEVTTNVSLSNSPSAVNRNGTLIALRLNGAVTVMDASLNTVRTLPGLNGGVVFDPVRDVLYGVNTTSGQICAYDTTTWNQQYTLAVGETAGSASAFGNGVMAVSGDGGLLFLSTPSGVRQYATLIPTNDQFAVGGFPVTTTAGVAGSITVTALDAQDHLLTGYTGTVHFTSSDSQAVLPADYTFTAADAGVHTFANVVLKTAGTQSVSVKDVASATVVGSQGNITVRAAPANTLVFSGFPSPTVGGASQSFMLTARDAYGNLVTDYAGTVHFTTSDAAAVLPADYTFRPFDREC